MHFHFSSDFKTGPQNRTVCTDHCPHYMLNTNTHTLTHTHTITQSSHQHPCVEIAYQYSAILKGGV